MDNTAILANLRHELTNLSHLDKPQVVYILVELRKLLEQDKSGQYRSLKFNCDWPLHPNLNGRGAQELIQRFDEAESASFNGDIELLNLLLEDLNAEVLSAVKFREQFQDFLKLHKLPCSICDIGNWCGFLEVYGQIIQHSTLELAPKTVKHIKQVNIVYHARPPAYFFSQEDQFMFALEWIPIRVDGRKSNTHLVNFVAPRGTARLARKPQP